MVTGKGAKSKEIISNPEFLLKYAVLVLFPFKNIPIILRAKSLVLSSADLSKVRRARKDPPSPVP